MEARAALLGDVRTNHPDRWTRPQLLNGGSGQRVDLKTVHVVVQLRIDDPSEKELLHPALLAAAKKLDGGGLYLQAVEALRSYRNANGDVVGHLGVADGVSQPSLSCQPQKGGTFHDDAVRSGELLLGRANARGDAAPSVQDPFLQDGSFLVVRKLRLFMDRLDKVAPPGQQGMKLLEKMFGRGAGGAPLHGLPANGKHPNDFAFDTQEASDACPYHSHIRRSNPRDGRPYTPRILRRGMSYGPESTKDRTTDRGVMFMAYCASITEQFETIQRWVAGGNSSGVGSAQGDPLLRVPQEGEKYTFRYVEKETVPAPAPGVQPPDKFVVQRVEFDDQPLVQLQWGLYTFVPSLAALRSLDQFAVPRPPAAAAAAATAPAFDPEAADLEAVRSLVEDREKNALVWEWVRTRNPAAPQNRAYGKLLGTHDEVLAVMKDDGTSYSVHGYGVRKGLSIGPNLLGMDPNDAQRKQELPVRDAIARITESVAFATALTEVDKALAKILPIPSAPGDPARRPLDLVTFSDDVLAGVCTALFGVPDGTHLATGGRRPGRPEKPRCPGSLGSASRYIFGPHPRTEVVEEGQAHGDAVRKAVAAWYATRPSLANAPLSADIEKELQAQGVTADRIADNIAGTMLGFTPTVQGNFLRVMETWINEEKSLWDHQQVLFEHSPDKQLTLGQADTALRRRMLDAMRKHPVPELLWRSPVGSDRKADTTNTYRRVVLGIGSAMTNPKAPDELLFGRDCPASEKPTVHGCPGYEMAMGVLLAMIGGVLKAGTLRPTGSPVLLVITDRE
nr:Dyp-type peroxidase domain-containing protein [Ramlibacter cellulosilyticus]